MAEVAFQDQGSVQHCFGCGADNDRGLHLKSYWQGDEAVAEFVPEPHHCGWSPDVAYGGLVASLIDCHTCNLAIAHLYREANRPIGSEPKIYCATAQLNVSLIKPTPMDQPMRLTARIRRVDGRKIWVDCEVTCGGVLTARGEVLAVRIVDTGAAPVG